MLRGIAVAIVVAGLCSSAFAVDRVSSSEKGSVLVYPKVEIRMLQNGVLTQDTYISVNNDYFTDVHIVMFFVTEMCTVEYSDTDLTHDEAAYWRASDGLPKGVGPFGSAENFYPDPEGCPEVIKRGFLVLFATDAQNQQIRFNHLYGGAMVVNYLNLHMWEYNAYAYQALDPWAHGSIVGNPGEILFDGVNYEPCFDTLHMDFFASNNLANPAYPSAIDAARIDTDLTLVVADFDLTQGGSPYWTKADFWVWNQNEASRRTHYCIQKWDEFLLSSIPAFLIENLQTNKGRARIEGIENVECPDSTARPLLGVRATFGYYGQTLCGPGTVLAAGSNLFGSKTENAALLYDVTPGPGEKAPVVGNAIPSLKPSRLSVR
jgi:hypothetical protein